MIKFIFLLMFFHSIGVFASLVEKQKIGEWTFEHYLGPNSSQIKIDKKRLQTYFSESDYTDNYFFHKTTSQIKEIENFINNKLTLNISCPEEKLASIYDYLRYLFRVLSISYQVEAIKEYQKTLNNFELNSKNCEVDINEIVKTCRPKTKEMKEFITLSPKLYKNEDDIFKNSFKVKEDFGQWLLGTKKSLIKDVTRNQLLLLCQNKKCRNQTKKDIEKNIQFLCQREKKNISIICNEVDQFYGYYQANILKNVLKSSHVMTLLNFEGFANSCVERFVNAFKNKELQKKYFSELFDNVFFLLKNDQYVTGKLFLAGSLKEFSEENKFSKIFNFSPLKTNSPFETALNLSVKKKKFVEVDLFQMKKIYFFSFTQLEKLEKSLKNFKSFNNLKNLKEKFQFGSKEQPIRLMFLWYLIYMNETEALQNLIEIYGGEFYLLNDIEKKKIPVKAKFKKGRKNWNLLISK